MVNRVYYKFENFTINGVKHWWELIWLVDQKRWSNYLYYCGTVQVPVRKRIDGKVVTVAHRTIPHVLYKRIDPKDIDIPKIFKTNKIEKITLQ